MVTINRESIPDLVMQQLKSYIIDNNMTSGDKLPSEPQLASSLGISRASIREAMKIMEGLGLIESIQGKGRFIRDFNYSQMLDTLGYNIQVHFHDFSEIVDIRKTLEEHYLPRAALQYTDEDYNELQSILDELKRAIDDKRMESELVEVHTRFHKRMYKVINNKLLDSLITVFATFQKILSDRIGGATKNNLEFYERHKLLLESLRTRDCSRIHDSFLDHFSDFDNVDWPLTEF